MYVPDYTVHYPDAANTALAVRAVGPTPQTKGDGSVKRMARTYRVAAPIPLSAELERQGFKVTKCLRIRSPWRCGLEVQYPERDGGAYYDYVKILLDHAGRESLIIQPGALRSACSNQFASPALRIRHTDPEIDRFLGNPAGFLRDIQYICRETAVRTESLRGVRLDCSYRDITKNRPRFWSAFWPELHHYRNLSHFCSRDRYEPEDAWTLVQALSATHSPLGVRAASILLQNDETLREEKTVQAYFDLFAPRPTTIPTIVQ